MLNSWSFPQELSLAQQNYNVQTEQQPRTETGKRTSASKQNQDAKYLQRRHVNCEAIDEMMVAIKLLVRSFY